MKITKILLGIVIVILHFPSALSAITIIPEPEKTIISGTFNTAQKNDTLTLTIWTEVVSRKKAMHTYTQKYVTVLKDDKFSFTIDSIEGVFYFSIDKGKLLGLPNTILPYQIGYAGDRLNILIIDTSHPSKIIKRASGTTYCGDCIDFKFSGPGSLKNTCLWEVEKKEQVLFADSNQLRLFDQISTKDGFIPLDKKLAYYFGRMKFILEGELKVVKHYKDDLPKVLYDVMMADVSAKTLKHFFNFYIFGTRYPSYGKKKESQQDRLAFEKFYVAARPFIEDVLNVPSNAKVTSLWYSEVFMQKLYLDGSLNRSQSLYDVIKRANNSKFRERLITNYILDYGDTDSLTIDALKFVVNKRYYNVLSNKLKNDQVGSVLYDFSLQDSAGKNVKLSDFKGKVVFIDFWYTGCGGCAYFFKNTLSAVEKHYASNNEVVFLSVSIDTDSEKWHKALKSGIYTADHSINLYTGSLGSRHPIIEQFKVTTYPHPLLVDKYGRLFSNDRTRLKDQGIETLIAEIERARLVK